MVSSVKNQVRTCIREWLGGRLQFGFLMQMSFQPAQRRLTTFRALCRSSHADKCAESMQPAAWRNHVRNMVLLFTGSCPDARRAAAAAAGPLARRRSWSLGWRCKITPWTRPTSSTCPSRRAFAYLHHNSRHHPPASRRRPGIASTAVAVVTPGSSANREPPLMGGLYRIFKPLPLRVLGSPVRHLREISWVIQMADTVLNVRRCWWTAPTRATTVAPAAGRPPHGTTSRPTSGLPLRPSAPIPGAQPQAVHSYAVPEVRKRHGLLCSHAAFDCSRPRTVARICPVMRNWLRSAFAGGPNSLHLQLHLINQ